jgi:hypothetical protein
MDEALAYDDFREALTPDVRDRFDRFFHALLADCSGVGRIAEVPAGPGCAFEAAVSPAGVAALRALAVGLDFGELWPAFRDVLGEDDDPPPDAAERLAAGFDEFRAYCRQWVKPLVAAGERGSGLVVV